MCIRVTKATQVASLHQSARDVVRKPEHHLWQSVTMETVFIVEQSNRSVHA